jgi:hypothetical protein
MQALRFPSKNRKKQPESVLQEITETGTWQNGMERSIGDQVIYRSDLLQHQPPNLREAGDFYKLE